MVDRLVFSLTILLLFSISVIAADEPVLSRAEAIRSRYAKFESMVPMRDGTRLFTAVYVPYEASSKTTYPILLVRTPYGSGPYGADSYRTRLGPSVEFEKEGFIFAFQDVRGRNLSEGTFVNMRPHQPNKTKTQFDER